MTDLTIDELARAAETTVRNVRAYQTRGLLPPPRRQGRANVYDETHLARLRLIGRLLTRGYTLANISEMLEAFERGDGVSEFLGLETAITSPWTLEIPESLTFSDLSTLFGPTVRLVELERAVRLGVLRQEDGRFVAPSPRLLQVGVELVRAGIPLSSLLDTVEDLRDDVEHIAERFVGLIAREVFDRWGEDAIPPQGEHARLTEFVVRVRPMAQAVVEVELGRALEDAIHAALGERLARRLGGSPVSGGAGG